MRKREYNADSIANLNVLRSSDSPPELIVFKDVNYQGDEWRTNIGYSYVGDDWNDQISSFIVVSGVWQFYLDADFKNPCGGQMGPGYCSFVGDVGIPNDSISSFQPIALALTQSKKSI